MFVIAYHTHSYKQRKVLKILLVKWKIFYKKKNWDHEKEKNKMHVAWNCKVYIYIFDKNLQCMHNRKGEIPNLDNFAHDTKNLGIFIVIFVLRVFSNGGT